MTWRTVSEILDAEYVEATRVSPPGRSTSGRCALAAQCMPARPARGGTNYLSWLHVRLFLEQQQGGRS